MIPFPNIVEHEKFWKSYAEYRQKVLGLSALSPWALCQTYAYPLHPIGYVRALQVLQVYEYMYQETDPECLASAQQFLDYVTQD